MSQFRHDPAGSFANADWLAVDGGGEKGLRDEAAGGVGFTTSVTPLEKHCVCFPPISPVKCKYRS